MVPYRSVVTVRSLIPIGNPASPDCIFGPGLAGLSPLPELQSLDMRYVAADGMDLAPLVPIKSLKKVNHALELDGDRWTNFREQRPDVRHVDEIILSSRKAGAFGAHAGEIP